MKAWVKCVGKKPGVKPKGLMVKPQRITLWWVSELGFLFPKILRSPGPATLSLADGYPKNTQLAVKSTSLTHILNKEGVCLRIHLDVLKTFQWLPIGNVVMLHGSTGSIFGWVPCDLQAHFSGQQSHMPWLQRVVSYTNSATINFTARADWENAFFNSLKLLVRMKGFVWS